MSKFEKVAKAICRASYSTDQWDSVTEAQRILFRSEASAALIELRDPDGIYPHQVGAWQGIIDSILKDAK